LSGGILVTGASGILGDALLASGLLPDPVGVVHTRSSQHSSVTLDLRDASAVSSTLADQRPRVVIHTVALTDVDACERNPGAAFAISAGTTDHLATWLAQSAPDALLVYVSTDQVYGGEGPHAEERTQPVNVYGQAKRAGELAAAQAPRHLILRTNFFGHSEMRPSYTDWIATTVREGKDVRVDPSSSFSALHLADLTRLLALAVDRQLEGTFNLGAHDSMRKLEFARSVAAATMPGGEERVGPLEAAPGRAPRPVDLRLDVSRIEAALGESMPTMSDGVARAHEDMRRAERAA
jgi:dTDP-4-dehydrorhamnose reductase